MKASLVPLDHPGPIIPLTRPVYVVGRHPSCDIHIDNDSLSRRHAILALTDGTVVVRDLITTNGTKVNSQRIKWAALMPNDKISFGTARYRLDLAPDTAMIPDNLLHDGPIKSMTDLFGNPDSPVPGPIFQSHRQAVESDMDSGLGDDSQNTELGGWRPDLE